MNASTAPSAPNPSDPLPEAPPLVAPGSASPAPAQPAPAAALAANPKPLERLRRRLRAVQLGFCIGVAGFFLGVSFGASIAQDAAELLQSAPMPLRFGVLAALGQSPVWLLTPLLCGLAGLLFDGPRWTVGISAAIGAQAFPTSLALVAIGWDGIGLPQLVATATATLSGALLSTLAFGRTQRSATIQPRDA